MHFYLKFINLFTATILLCIASPFLPSLYFQILSPAQAQTNEARQAEEVYDLLDKGVEQAEGGQLQEALQTFQEALANSRRISDRDLQRATLTNIAIVYRRLGRYDQALKFYQQVLPLSYQPEEILLNIGNTYLKLGQSSEALNSYRQAIASVKEPHCGTESRVSPIVEYVGRVYESRGQNDLAQEFYRQADEATRQQEAAEKPPCRPGPPNVPLPRVSVLRDDDDQPPPRRSRSSQPQRSQPGQSRSSPSPKRPQN